MIILEKHVQKFLIFSFLTMSLKLFTLNTQDSSFFKIQFKGFVKSNLINDSRQTVSARECFVLLYPQKPIFDITLNPQGGGMVLQIPLEKYQIIMPFQIFEKTYS